MSYEVLAVLFAFAYLAGIPAAVIFLLIRTHHLKDTIQQLNKRLGVLEANSDELVKNKELVKRSDSENTKSIPEQQNTEIDTPSKEQEAFSEPQSTSASEISVDSEVSETVLSESEQTLSS